MIRDPRATKYIYNLQITAPSASSDTGRHIVIGPDKVKMGYDIDSAWIKTNEPLKILSNDIDINGKIKIKDTKINLNSNIVDVKNDKNIGFVWQGNLINFNSGLELNTTDQVKFNNNIKVKGGKSEFNLSNLATEFANTQGTNIISGDTQLNGNLKTIGNLSTLKDLNVDGAITFLGGKHNDIQLGASKFPLNGKNYLSGDTQINGSLDIINDTNISGSLFTKNNISSTSLNISGPTVTTTLQVDGKLTSRGLESSQPSYFQGGKSEFNPNSLQTQFPFQGDMKNYIRGDTEVTGNLNALGDINIGRNSTVNGQLNVTGKLNSNNIKVNGNLEIGGNLIGGTNNIFPKGMIVLWTGTVAPTGWALCDGSTVNGLVTPDLRGRFVLGYSNYGGKFPEVPGKDFNVMNGTGGEQTHALSVNEIPSHSHSVSLDRPTLDHNCWKSGSCSGAHLVNGNGWSGNSSNTGGNGSHNNMPPYYVLAYIIKV